MTTISIDQLAADPNSRAAMEYVAQHDLCKLNESRWPAYISQSLRTEIAHKLFPNEPVDFFARPIKEGDMVIKAGNSWIGIDFGVVTRVAGDRVYVSGSKVHMHYNEKLTIIQRADGSVPPFPVTMP